MKAEKIKTRIELYEKHIADMEAKNQTTTKKYARFKIELERYKAMLDEASSED